MSDDQGLQIGIGTVLLTAVLVMLALRATVIITFSICRTPNSTSW